MLPQIREILARAAALRDETALNSIDPERAGGIMYDTLMALNELWLQQGAALVISKIYASVDDMSDDNSPVSDLTGLPLRAGQIVCVAGQDPTSTDYGVVYRFDGLDGEGYSGWSAIGRVGSMPYLPGYLGKDLSMFDVDGASLVQRSTANCYVVRSPGLYKFPVVYGNAIKNGANNTQAYTSGGGTYQAQFVNHLGEAITSPYIEKNANCQPASAALLWQTGAGLISSVSLIEGGDCKYISFMVAEVPATNGSALLVVKDSGGNIMWSWHIWLTSDALGPADFENNTQVKYRLMTENLGCIWNAERTVFYNPHFQWGRKDPMAPVDGSGSQCTLYDINGNVYSGYGALGTDGDESADKTVANAIKNPNLFFTRHNSSNHNWNNLAWFNNFWNNNLNTDSSLADDQDTAKKTIYDPCPTGWMLPSGRAFTGFTTTGSNTSDSTQFNVVGSWATGWKFKKNANDGVGNLFPASGYRANDSGALAGVGGGGDCWSYAPDSQAYARHLYFHSGSVYPLNGNYRSYGFSVRPCREFA